jgi:hypothetical protein
MPSHRRSQRGKAGHKLGNHQRDGAAAAKGVLCTPDADRRFQRQFAQDAQHMVPVAAANEEPDAVCHQRRNQPSQQGKRKTDLMLGRKRSGGQQHRRCRQRNSELLHQNPGEEQQVPVHQQDVFR